MQTAFCVLAATLLASVLPFRSEAKSYSGGGGHSYSSHSSSSGGSHSFSSGGSHSSSSGSSHSFSSGSGHSFSSGGSHSPSGGSSHSSSAGRGTHSASSGGGAATSHGGGVSQRSSSGRSSGEHFSSGSGKSYSAGSTWNENSRHSYTSGKSYSSGEGHNFTSSSGNDSGTREIQSTPRTEPYSGGSPPTFDTAAAHARKEQASKEKFTQFKESQLPPSASPGDTPRSTASSYRVQAPPLPGSGGGSYRTKVYVPDAVTISSRPVRIYSVFNPYYSRPVVVYSDPYNSLFWWWLLDRSLDDRAWWAYHHRYDMDPARYQALVVNDQQLEARVQQLETQQAPRDPNYVPPGVDRDLMYSDHYVAQSYSNRPTTAGVFAFWLLAVPTALGLTGFFIWLIWFKRWQTAT
jgi:hypothetical protein